jgi:hypothetical protein
MKGETAMIWKYILRWALAAIAVPLAAVGARRLSEAVESRRRGSRTARVLRRSSDVLQRFSRRSSRKARRPRLR